MGILRANAETVEVVGLDEAYLDLTGLFAPKATMRRIATEIREDTGLTCSVGISENRLLAKITSELGKPAGPRRPLARGSAGALRRRAARPRPRDRPEDRASSWRGWASAPSPSCAPTTRSSWSEPSGPAAALAAGPRPLRGRDADRGRARDRSRSRRRRPSTSTSPTASEMAAHVASLAKELCRRLRSRDLAGRTIGIKVRLDDWTNVTRAHTLDEPTNDPDDRHPHRPRPPPRLRPTPPRPPARRQSRQLLHDEAAEPSRRRPRCNSACRIGAIPVGVERLVLFRRGLGAANRVHRKS